MCTALFVSKVCPMPHLMDLHWHPWKTPKPEVEPFQAANEAFQAVPEVETLQEAPEVEAFKYAPRWAPCVKYSLWGALKGIVDLQGGFGGPSYGCPVCHE